MQTEARHKEEKRHDMTAVRESSNCNPNQSKPGDTELELVELNEEEDSHATKADVPDQGGKWRPALQQSTLWRRRTLTRRLTSSSLAGNLDECTEGEAESHPAKASRTSQRDGGDKSTSSGSGARRQRRQVEPQGDAGRGPRAKLKSM